MLYTKVSCLKKPKARRVVHIHYHHFMGGPDDFYPTAYYQFGVSPAFKPDFRKTSFVNVACQDDRATVAQTEEFSDRIYIREELKECQYCVYYKEEASYLREYLLEHFQRLHPQICNPKILKKFQ